MCIRFYQWPVLCVNVLFCFSAVLQLNLEGKRYCLCVCRGCLGMSRSINSCPDEKCPYKLYDPKVFQSAFKSNSDPSENAGIQI